MTRGRNWSISDMDPEIKDMAYRLAHREGMSLTEWLSMMLESEMPSARGARRGGRYEEREDDSYDDLMARIRNLSEGGASKVNAARSNTASAQVSRQSEPLDQRTETLFAETLKAVEKGIKASEAKTGVALEALTTALELKEKQRIAELERLTAQLEAGQNRLLSRLEESNRRPPAPSSAASNSASTSAPAQAATPPRAPRQHHVVVPPTATAREKRLESIFDLIDGDNGQAEDMNSTRAHQESSRQESPRQLQQRDSGRDLNQENRKPIETPESRTLNEVQQQLATLTQKMSSLSLTAQKIDVDSLVRELEKLSDLISNNQSDRQNLRLEKSLMAIAENIDTLRYERSADTQNEDRLNQLESMLGSMRRMLSSLDTGRSANLMGDEVARMASRLQNLDERMIDAATFRKFQTEIADLRHVVSNALPQKLLSTLEEKILLLDDKLEHLAARPQDGATMARLDTLMAQVTSLLQRENPAIAMQQIEQHIDRLASIESKVESIATMLSMQPEVRISEQDLTHLNVRFDQIHQHIMNHTPVNMRLNEHELGAINARFDEIHDTIQDTLQNSVHAVHAPHQDQQRLIGLLESLSHKLSDQNFSQSLSHAEPAQQNAALEALQYDMRRLAGHIERGGDQHAGLSNIERGVSDLFTQMESLRDHAPHESDLKKIQEKQEETERRSLGMLEAVHHALAGVSERLAQLERNRSGGTLPPAELSRENEAQRVWQAELQQEKQRLDEEQARIAEEKRALQAQHMQNAPQASSPQEAPAAYAARTAEPDEKTSAPALNAAQRTRLVLKTVAERNPAPNLDMPAIRSDAFQLPAQQEQSRHEQVQQNIENAPRPFSAPQLAADIAQEHSKTSYLEAARRAAQTAQAHSAAALAAAKSAGYKAQGAQVTDGQMHSQMNDEPNYAAELTYPEKAENHGQRNNPNLNTILPKAPAKGVKAPRADRKKTILLGLAALIFALGSVKAITGYMNERGNKTVVQDAAKTQSVAKPSQGNSSQNTQNNNEPLQIAPQEQKPATTQSQQPRNQNGIERPLVPATTKKLERQAEAQQGVKTEVAGKALAQTEVKTQSVKAESVKPVQSQTAEKTSNAVKSLGDTNTIATAFVPAPENDPVVVGSIAGDENTKKLDASSNPEQAKLIDAAGIRLESRLGQAALLGDLSALYEIGDRMLSGRNAKQDVPGALKFFEQAAARGHAPSQYRIGNIYREGRGVAPDVKLARLWLKRAAAQNHALAMHNYGVLLADGKDSSPDYASAAEWFGKAANFGVKDSQFNLAVLSMRGLGTAQDMQDAYKWFELAARQGDKDSARQRDALLARFTPEQAGLAKARLNSFKLQQPDPRVNDVAQPKGGWEAEGIAAVKANQPKS